MIGGATCPAQWVVRCVNRTPGHPRLAEHAGAVGVKKLAGSADRRLHGALLRKVSADLARLWLGHPAVYCRRRQRDAGAHPGIEGQPARAWPFALPAVLARGL